MFAKLLKHEWMDSVGTLGVLSLVALGISVLATAALRVLIHFGSAAFENEDTPLILAMVVLGMLLFFLIVGLIVYVVACQIILLVRFYKNKFTDEGYLTFTLPVNCHQIFLSSLIVMAAWMVLSMLVLAVGAGLIIFVGTAREGLINTDIIEGIFYAYGELSPGDLPEAGAFGLLYILQIVVSLFCTPIISMTCLTLGAVIAKKHKILAAFGAYYVISMISGLVSGIVGVAVMILEVVGNMPSTALLYAVQILIMIVFAAVGYFVSTYLMRHKLNLP